MKGELHHLRLDFPDQEDATSPREQNMIRTEPMKFKQSPSQGQHIHVREISYNVHVHVVLSKCNQQTC